MSTRRRNASVIWLAAIAIVPLLQGCRSVPIHYYSLATPASGEAVALSGAARFKLYPVQVPPEVDRSELVLRRGRSEVLLVENEQWISPLPGQLWQAVSVELARALRAEPGANDPTQPRIQLQIERFEAEIGHQALIQAQWRVAAGTREIRCDGRFTQSVAPGYAALVTGFQQAVVTLTDAIAESTQRSVLETGRCPQSLARSPMPPPRPLD